MPHVIIEYSANLEEAVDVRELVRAAHTAVRATGIAPLTGLRTRGARRELYEVADGAPENAFVNVVARLAAGRTTEQRAELLEVLLEVVDDRLGEARRSTVISVECQEIEPEMRLSRNHLTAGHGGAEPVEPLRQLADEQEGSDEPAHR